MNLNLLDITIIVILAFYLISGMYRGFITSLLGTVGFVGAWFGAQQLYPRVAQLALSNQTLMAVLNQYLEPESFFSSHTQAVSTVSEVIAGGEAAIQNAVSSVSDKLSVISKAFEANVRAQMFQRLGINTLADYLDQTIWQAVFNVGAFLLCFIALYVLACLVVNLLDHVISFPLVRGFDWLLCGIFGIARGLAVVVLVLFALFYPRIFAVTFDEPFARATGVRAGSYNLLIALLTALTVVVGMRMMGTLLISSLIIFPALSSMRVFSRFRSVTICSAIISVACFLAGMMLSCVYSLPTGAGIVAVNLVVFIAFSAIGAARN